MPAQLRTLVRAPGAPGKAAVAAVLVLATALAGCTASGGSSGTADEPAGSGGASASSGSSEQPVSAATVSSNVPSADGGERVAVDETVRLEADQGSFEEVSVTFGPRGRELAGELSEDATVWTSTDRLEPNRRYRLSTVAVDADGAEKAERSVFRTDDLSLDEQTYPSIAPLDGETVGVGMPVIVTFDVAVTDRASIERHLEVESSPRQAGSWHWISDNEVHWRPKDYWKPGTDVEVHADVNSIPAGDGIYGQLSRSTSFTVGDAMVSKVDIANHQMKVYRNGSLLRTIPVSTGKPGFTTRSGTKVIIEKFREKRMDAATTGIDESDPEYYDIDDVEYAMRVTYSGEFLHAAPWSVGSQGNANVSHGCVGMSTTDAGWVYDLSKRGDVVEFFGSDRQMTLTNGYGDWNASFAEYRQGSALG